MLDRNAVLTGVQKLVGGLPGVALAVGAGALARLRGTKPLHPSGVVGHGTLTVTGKSDLGLPFFQMTATYPVLARFSWAIGTGPDRSDIHGLAVRFTAGGRIVDWLFASTGAGSLDRFALELRSPGEMGTLGTLLPVKSPVGPLLLTAEPRDRTGVAPPRVHDIFAATGSGAWERVGFVEVDWGGSDEAVRFDAVAHVTPGCTSYPVVTAVRAPAYAAARALRRHPRPDDPLAVGSHE